MNKCCEERKRRFGLSTEEHFCPECGNLIQEKKVECWFACPKCYELLGRIDGDFHANFCETCGYDFSRKISKLQKVRCWLYHLGFTKERRLYRNTFTRLKHITK